MHVFNNWIMYRGAQRKEVGLLFSPSARQELEQATLSSAEQNLDVHAEGDVNVNSP